MSDYLGREWAEASPEQRRRAGEAIKKIPRIFSVKEMKEIVEEYGEELGIGPTMMRTFASSNGRLLRGYFSENRDKIKEVTGR